MKDLIINQTNISDHEVIASIANITQAEKDKIEEILAQQKKLTDEDAGKAKQTLDDLAKNSPLEHALYLAFSAQMEKKKSQLKLESQKKILEFIESTKEWKFLNDPAGNPYSFSRTFPGPGGSEFAITHEINSVYQRDVLLKDDYTQTPSEELVANFINQVRLSVRNVLLYIRQQQGDVSKEIARIEAEISQLDAQINAAEQARVAAAAEQARLAAEAAEQARVAAEAEAKRVADEAAAAEAARVAAEAAAEQARLAAEAEAKRVADQAAADAAAKVAAEAEVQRVAQQHAARQVVFRTAGTLTMPANVSAITVSGQGLIQIGQGAAALAQAIADGIAELGRVLVAGPGMYIATFLTLGLYSSPTASASQDRTPDRIRYGFGLKADQLGLPPGTDLQSIALAQGTVELPWRLTNEAKGDRSLISVVSADGVNVPKAVPVRAATLNATTGLYEVVLPSTIPAQPPITLTWTPAAAPGSENPSSTTPAVTPEIPVYTGTTLETITVTAETYPGVITTPEDLITWFPADSGIAPVYVMFSEPLDSGIFTRRQLQKKFDSHKEDFGFEGRNATNKTLAEFRDKILTHLSDPATIEKGTFHSELNSKVYFNPVSNLVVIVGIDGMFISGWHLEPGTRQYKVYIDTGVL